MVKFDKRNLIYHQSYKKLSDHKNTCEDSMMLNIIDKRSSISDISCFNKKVNKLIKDLSIRSLTSNDLKVMKNIIDVPYESENSEELKVEDNNSSIVLN